MNDFREMVRADLAARLKATVKRRRPKPKGTLPRAAIAAEVIPMFQAEARRRQGQRTDLEHLDQKTQKSAPVPVKRSERGSVGEAPGPCGQKITTYGTFGKARDGAAPGRSARNASDQLTGSVGEARDEAAAMMNVSPASVERDRLNRQTHGTFEVYCKERWGMMKSQAYRLIEAASVVEVVSPIGDKAPATESQARPLTKLEPEAQRQAWTQSNRRD